MYNIRLYASCVLVVVSALKTVNVRMIIRSLAISANYRCTHSYSTATFFNLSMILNMKKLYLMVPLKFNQAHVNYACMIFGIIKHMY